MQDFKAIDDSWIPDNSAEWFSWLASEEEKSRNSYLAKPATLIADYRKEKSITRAYEGREILELLQNAADQAREHDCAGRVVIELLPEGLIVANTGASFSVGGVQSLETAHLSPKWRKRRHLIGNKGLGFRSILNWSHSPIILSGALSLAYCPDFLKQTLSSLIKNPEIKHRVDQERGETDELILPLLPFPGYSESGCLDPLLANNSATLIFERCKAWREKGYDTIVGMPFDRPNAYKSAKKQLKILRPEVLLFVTNLAEIRFVTPNTVDRMWRLEGNDDLSMVIQNGEPLGLWRVHRKTDAIPEDKLDPDQNGPLDYEVAVAIPDVVRIEELKTSPLFSHFPTEIELPLPVVCHVTLELNQNRNHTEPRKSNKYVLDQLAIFLAEVAESRSRNYPEGPNAGFRLLLPLSNYPSDLVREEFPEQLILAAQERAIIPTLSGIPMCPKDARIVKGEDNSWLPATVFPEVAVVRSEKEREFFAALKVPQLVNNELRRRIIEHKDLSVNERASLISGLIRYEIDRSVHSSSLLLDNNNDTVLDASQVFLAPSATSTPTLPDWMSLRFLHDGLRIELMRQLKAQDVRDLQGKLSSFGVLEYSLANLIRRLLTDANRLKRRQPDLTTKIDEDVRAAVFSFFLTEGKTGKRPDFPANVSLPLPTQAGATASADKLYFGSGYGSHGNILQSLYTKSLDKLVVAPDRTGLTGSPDDIQAFLTWIGVAEWPREEFNDHPDDGFLNFVLGKILYPTKFGEYFFETMEKVQNPRLTKIRSVDSLKEILSNAPPAAITAWLALDTRIHHWLRPQTDNAQLTARYSADINLRLYRNPLPSYLRWKIESTSWIPSENGELLRPRDCVLGQRAIEALFPRPPKPSSEEMDRFRLVDADLIEGWRRAGVLTSLAELELEDIYARLTELPERDPEGKLARSLYRWLLDASDLAMGSGAAAKERFIKSGKMWGVHREITGYYPVNDLRHADSEGLPTSLLSNLNIVDLPYRLGPDKVERVFGVKAIDRMGIDQRVRSYQLSANLDQEFQKAKPFLYLLRNSQTIRAQYLKSLKSLSLRICSELTAVIKYEDQEFEFMPPIWGWLIENDVLYVRSDPAEPLNIANDLLADTIGAAIASIFRIGDGGEFARMFLCAERDRKSLLLRIRGEVADENMEQIIADFGAADTSSRVATMPASQPIEDPTVKPVQPKDPQTNTVAPPEKPEETEAPSPNPSSGGPLSILPEPHNPVGTPIKHPLRIQRTTGGAKPTVTHKVTDGAFCERKAVEFEETCDPPRFPLLVGQITGSLAFGCDILSFSTPDDREAFRSGADRNLAKITRFIEVKGRKHESGAIELKGNELNSAIENNARFYLYRLYKYGIDEYQLSILQNPLEQKEALASSIYVDLNRAKDTKRFALTGGLQEDSEGKFLCDEVSLDSFKQGALSTLSIVRQDMPLMEKT
ncbi:MAG: hypothetical protein CVU69_08125 [Deltaproteobacteria bacterium HGW-Deltaproteobacteria-4]|nr:MAG: hypothetical protein CVU69_08125 [Deltaproteobacteria bacterium HGW-Deltaproteobacteria-4]